MSERAFNRAISTLAALLISAASFADDGAPTGYTPYSIYGVGEMAMPGSAYNHTMGGVGAALRDHKYINFTNPAAVTARDSLSFMFDFTVHGTNKVFRQTIDGETAKSAKNMASIGDIYMSFPIWRKYAAMYAGVSQFSSMGYAYKNTETDAGNIYHLGHTIQTSNGIGGLYQFAVGAGFEFFKRVSVGAEFDFIFGQLAQTQKVAFSNTSAVGISVDSDKDLKAYTGKFGIQYLQPIGSKFKFGLGATYRLATDMKGYVETTRVSTVSDVDTVDISGIKLADELVVGLSLKFSDKLTISFDWSRSDWTTSGFDQSKQFAVKDGSMPFASTVSQAYRIGAEFIPNPTDVRYYFKRVAYRAGGYWKKDYFTVAGNNVNAWGVTVGATIPVFRWYNGLTFGFEFGQRGNKNNGMVAENFFNFSLAVNLFDIWFQKPKYE